MMPQEDKLYSSEQGWTVTAPTYGSNLGRTSAHAAARLVHLVNRVEAITDASKLVDVGAGAGAVAVHVAATTKGQVTATDIHQQMLDSIQVPRGVALQRQVADARSLSKRLGRGVFSHALSTFMLQTVTNPKDVLKEMRTVLTSPGGVVGIAVWGLINDPFVIWERACRSIDPSYSLPTPFDDPNAWQTRRQLGDALSEAGFLQVTTEDLSMPFPFQSTAAFVDFWFGAKNPAALRVMSNWSGDGEQVRAAVARICKEQFDDGKTICTQAVLGVGRL